MKKPSEIHLVVPLLCGTLGRAEVEFAAGILVRACQALGDEWAAHDWDEVRGVLKDDLAAGQRPFAQLLGNPFFRPDFDDLIARGFATRDQDGRTALTPAAIERIEARWS